MPAFKQELAHLMISDWSHKKVGMPGKVLLKGGIRSIVEPWLFTKLPVAEKESEIEYKRAASSQALAFVLTKGDTDQFWLSAVCSTNVLAGGNEDGD